MFEIDPIKYLEKITSDWEDRSSLFKSLILVSIIWFGVPWIFSEKYEPFSSFNLFLPLLILFIIFLWLYTTNRIFVKKTIGIAFYLDDETKIHLVKQLFNTVVKKIQSNKELKFLTPKLLPPSLIKSENDLNTYLDQNSYLETLIWFDINTGKENNIDSMLINKTSFCARFNNPIAKNFIADLQIRHATKDWKYIDSNSLNDKTKIKNNLFDIIIFYNGLFSVYKSKFQEGIQILKNLYNSNERRVKAELNKENPGKLKISVNSKNIIAGRLAVILQSCFIEASRVLHEQKDYSGAYLLLRQAETTLVNIPDPYNFYIGLAIYSFECGRYEDSKKYTEKMKNIKGSNSLEVILNQGFYAIIENDIYGFIKNYICLVPKPTDQNFVIIRDFLDRHSFNYPNSRLLFTLADGIITKFYLTKSEGNRIIKSVIDQIKNENSDELRDLRFFSYKMLRK